MTNHHFKFTKARLAELVRDPSRQRTTFYDTEVPGLQVRLTIAGTKTFAVRKRPEGSTEASLYTIGRFPQVSIANARIEAKKVLGRYAAGADPQAEKMAARIAGATLAEVLDHYLEVRTDLKPRTRKDYQVVIQWGLSDWLDRPLSEINADQVRKKHLQLGKRSRARADNAMRVLRALITYWIDENGTDSRILTNVVTSALKRQWFRPPPRRTYIEPHQLPAWFSAVLQSQSETARDMMLLIVMTGLRDGEARTLRWCNVNFSARKFLLPDTKNGDPHELPMSNYVHELLKRRHAAGESDEWVFPGPGPKGHITKINRAVCTVRKRSEVYFTIHDLRRTFATIAESLDIPHYALKRMLNHRRAVGGDVTAGYIQITAERLRKPMQQVTDYVLRAAGQKPTATVTAISERA